MIEIRQKYELELTCRAENEKHLIKAIADCLNMYCVISGNNESRQVINLEHLTGKQRDAIIGALSLLQDCYE